MLLSITFLILVSSLNIDDIIGQIFAIYIIVVAGAESAIGLGILVAFYRLSLSLISTCLSCSHKGLKKIMHNFFKLCSSATLRRLAPGHGGARTPACGAKQKTLFSTKIITRSYSIMANNNFIANQGARAALFPLHTATQRCVGTHPYQHNCVGSHPNWRGKEARRGTLK